MTALVVATVISVGLFATPAAANPLEDMWNGIVSFFSGDAGVEAAAAGAESTEADGETLKGYEAHLTEGSISTQNIGRIWTDKTVQDTDINLTGGIGGAGEVKKGTSDFLVGLSALSSMSTITNEIPKPLDIVLVLDTSSSMLDQINGEPEYEPVAASEVTVDNGYYWVNVDGQYKQIWNMTNGTSWYWTDGSKYYCPEGSDEYYADVKTTFYSIKNSKLAALKEAVNGFIASTDDANKEMPADQKHQIALVRFSDGEKSQIVSEFTDNAANLENKVNNLPANGSTRADIGINYASGLMDAVTRSNSQKVVIFFTDGQPNNRGGAFDPTVANASITAASAMNAKDILFYSVGVFEGANPNQTEVDGTDISKFNAYMNGVSSNYPNAKAYDDLGTREGTREYYKVASDQAGLAQVFQDIASELREDISKSPLSSAVGAGSEEGYITFTDELGAYMKVDDFKSIVYANTQLKDPKVTTSDDGLTVTYTFSGTVDGNEIFGKGNMADVIVTVQKAAKDNLAQGDIVTVKIPASLIPLRNYKATVKKDGSVEWNEVTDAYPIRVFYGVSLKDGVADSIKNGTADNALKDYVKKHTEKTGENDNQHDAVTFLSNKFEGKSGEGSGTTTAHFVPAKSNSYYYVDVDTPLYIDRDCKTPLTKDNWERAEDGRFYYQQTFYKQGETRPFTETVEFPTTSLEAVRGQLTPNDKGEYYLPVGMPRLTRIHEFEEAKKDNANSTNTAALAVNPNWNDESADASSINVQLGNNGKLFVELPGTLKVSKAVTVADGLDKTQFANTEFPFTIHVDSMANTTVKARLTNTNGGTAIGDPIDLKFDGNSDATYKLKDGQTLVIYGLNDGADYTVTEGTALNTDGTENPGFTQTDPANNASETGTISSAGEKIAAFTNNYSVSEATSSPFKAKKTFTDISDPANEKSMAWDGATFTFEVSAIGGASSNQGVTGSRDQFNKPIDAKDVPLPQDAQGNKVTSLTVTEDNKDNVDFGTAHYTKPGTYVYHITEHTPSANEGWLPGISYSNAIYHIEVVVEDNGQGALTINGNKSTMYMETSDAGADGDNTKVDVANITNTYQRDADTAQLLAKKEWVDTTGSRPNVAKDQFSFTVEAVRGQDANGQTIAEDDIPMPEGKLTIGNADDGSVAWGNITFTNQMAGNTYTYKLTEDIPAGAVENPTTGKYEYQGVEYSNEEYTATVTVTVTSDPNDPTDPNKQQTKVEVTYTDKEGNPVTDEAERVVFTNTYRVQEIADDSTLLGQKTLDGRNMKSGEEFTFKLTGVDKTTQDALANGDITGLIAEAKATGTGTNTVAEFNFGTPTFKKPGTYTFEIHETGTDGNGLIYDKHASTVTYVVNDSDPNDETIAHTGKLRVVSVTYDNSKAAGADQDYGDRVAFTNTYRSNADFDGITVSKTLTGRNMLANEFNFTITPEGDSPVVSPAADAAFSNPQGRADGQKLQMTGKLSGLKFTQADAGKTYSYIVDEVQPSDAGKDDLPGVDYDTKRYRVSITLNDDGNGTLTPQTTIQEIDAGGVAVGRPVNEAAFSNAYTPEKTDPVTPQLSKVLDGRNWTAEDSFTFNVSKVSFNNQTSGKDFAAMPMFGDTSKAVTAAAGTASKTPVPFNFGSLTFEKAGTYVYKVTETIPGEATNEDIKSSAGQLIAYKDASDEQKKVAGWKLNGVTYTDKEATITIRVSDDGADGKKTGKLVATVSYANNPFTNTYNATQYFDDAVDFQLAKTLNGHDMKQGQFKFNVTALDDPAGSTKAIETAQKVGLPTDKLTFAVIGAAGDDGQRVPMMDGARQLSFTSADSGKTFVLQFDEVQEKKDGYTYDQTVYQMAIKPTDLGDGTMSIHTVVTKVNNAQGKLVNETYIDKSWTSGTAAEEVALDFVNTYKSEGTTEIPGTKKVEGPWEGDLPGFTFSIEQVANENGEALVEGDKVARAEFTEGTTVTSDANGDFKFEGIKFTKPGDYFFRVTESNNLGDGWSKKDADPKIIKVSVVEAEQDTGNGELIATPDTDDLKALTFTNTYTQKPSDAYAITIKKAVAGHDATANQFKFQLIADAAAKAAIKSGAITGVTVDETTGVVATESNKDVITAGGSEDITFEGMTFNKVTTGDGYTFTVKELVDKDDDDIKPDVQNNGWTMDGHEYRVNIKVTDSKPKLTATVTATGSSIFSNTFGAATTLGANGGLQVTKRLDGRTLVADQFDFIIQAAANADNADVAASKLAKLADVKDGVLSFKNVDPNDSGIAVMDKLGELAFDQKDIGKTFTYTVSEILNDAMDNAGYDFDANLEATVTIAVKEGDKGKIYTETTVKKGDDTKTYGKDAASAAGDTAVVPFVNSYSATGELDGSVNLAGTKTLVDNEGNVVPLNGRAWDFTLSAADGDTATAEAIAKGIVTLPKDVKVQNNADGEFNFGNITFKSTGAASVTYKFKVTESGKLKGVDNDPDAERLVEVRVTDNGNGTLTAEVVGDINLNFVNTYGKDATAQAEVKGTKTLALAEGVDNAPSIKNEFSFTLAAVNSAPFVEGDNYVANPTNPNANGTGTVSFGKLKFTMADLAGEEYGADGTRSKEFTYTVTETGNVPGVQNGAGDPNTVKIKLTDDGEDNLTAELLNEFAFTNTYVPAAVTNTPVDVIKVLKGRTPGLQANEFTFEMKVVAHKGSPADGFELPDDTTAKNDADGAVKFGDITFTKPGTYTVSVNEVVPADKDNKAPFMTYDGHTYSYDVVVFSDGSDKLQIRTENESGSKTFTNKYEAPEDTKDVTKTEDPETTINGQLVGVGDKLTYKINWVNDTVDIQGKATAATVTIKDTVPAGTTLVENGIHNGGTQDENGVITWTINAKPGQTGTVSFDVVVADTALSPVDKITNEATINVGGHDSKVTVENDFPKKTVEAPEGGVKVGDELTYTIQWANTSKDAAKVVVTDKLSEGLTFVEASKPGKHDDKTNTVTWDLGEQQAGESGEVTVKVRVNEKALTVNTDNKATIKVGNSTDVTTNTVPGPKPQSGSLTISKTVVVPVGLGLNVDKANQQDFTFTVNLTDAKGNKLTGEYAYTDVNGAKDGKLRSGDKITLKHNQSITIAGLPEGAKYTVTETKLDGFTPTPEDGVLKGTVSTDGATAAFTNTYGVQETRLKGAENLEVTKEISGRDWAKGDSFDFELTANENHEATVKAIEDGNITLPDNAAKITVNNNSKDHKAAFGDITFRQAGDFQFCITELGESHDGLTYNTEPKLVKVHVADNGDGSLTATVEEGENPTITNTYDVTGSGELALSGTKTIKNRAFDENDSFKFTVTGASDKDGVPAPLPKGDNVTTDGNTATVTVKPEAGKNEAAINYGTIAFDKSQLGAKFTYTVSEVNGGDTIDGLTYDKTVYTVTVKVVDNGQGGVKFDVLSVTKTPEAPAARAAEPVTKEQVKNLDFTNIYDSVMPNDESVKTNVAFTKVLDGRDWLDTDAFDFTLTAKTPGAPMPEDKGGNTVSTVKVTKDNAKGFSFGQIAFSYDMVKDAPNKTKTFEYEVAEVEPEQGAIPNVDYTNAKATVRITVADNGDGKLVATVTTTGETFTNIYTSNLDYGAMGGLSITKVLDGRDMLDKQFGFTVTAKDGVKTSAADTAKLLGIAKGTSATYDAPAAKNGETALVASLGSQIKFTQDDAGKTYAFTVEETKVGGEGYTNDTAVRTVEIAVADNGDGTLTATTTVSGKGEPQVFTYTTGQTPAVAATVPFANSYTTTPAYLGGEGNVQLNASKTLTGRDMAADEFGFAVVNTADASQVATGSNAAAADGAAAPVTFTPIEYTSAGLYADAAAGKATATAGQDGKVVYTYEYAVNEVSGLVDGVTGVTTAFSVRVSVMDNNDGTLGIEVVYPEGSGDTLAFANAYGLTAKADVTVSGQKRLATPEGTGYTAPDIAGKYTFTLEGSEGAPMPEKTEVVNDAAGNVSFGTITYTMENVFGDSGEVADAENGTGADADGDAAETGANAEAAPAKSAPREKTFTYTVKESGNVAGVTNDAEALKAFTVKVIDDGDGTITATPSTSGFAFSFVNAYAPQPVEVSIDPARKTLSGRDLRDGEFSFDLKDASGAVVKTVQNNAEGVVDLGALTFTAPGTYRYTVSEQAPQGGVQNGVTYDGAVYDLVVTVTDAGDGALKASASYKLKGQAVEQMAFTNSYRVTPNSISFRAAKILTGRDLKAGEFSFELREGDKVLQTVKNAADGSISFDAIEFTEPGEHDYQIAEVKGDAEGITYDKTVFTYHVSVVDNGDGTLKVTWTEGEAGEPVFRNTYQETSTPPVEEPEEPKPEAPKTEEPKKPEQQLPQTGDSMPSPMALGAMAAAGVGLIGCSVVLIKRNHQK